MPRRPAQHILLRQVEGANILRHKVEIGRQLAMAQFTQPRGERLQVEAHERSPLIGALAVLREALHQRFGRGGDGVVKHHVRHPARHARHRHLGRELPERVEDDVHVRTVPVPDLARVEARASQRVRKRRRVEEQPADALEHMLPQVVRRLNSATEELPRRFPVTGRKLRHQPLPHALDLAGDPREALSGDGALLEAVHVAT
mmetsp:Transcript_2891/g.8801  ORF Transcript_2891/g.8801 Transcript_2891/m.8801 type:complete len:202 (-) Transcript_2891:1765-2370(-)